MNLDLTNRATQLINVGNFKMEITLGDVIKIHPHQKASRRTKNRIKENGAHFIFMRKTRASSLFNGNTAFLLSAVTKKAADGRGGKESWLGWLPANEFDVVDSNPPETEAITLVEISTSR